MRFAWAKVVRQWIEGFARLETLVHLPKGWRDEVRGTFDHKHAFASWCRKFAFPVRCALVRRADLQSSKAVLTHILQIDALAGGRVPVDVVLKALRIGPLEVFFLEAEPSGQFAEDLIVGDGLARRLGALGVVGQVEVAPGQDHVLHLRSHRGRQQDVGIRGCVGDEVLGRDHEQILAHQAFNDLVGLGRLRDRIRVPAHHRHDGRIELHLAGQRAADLQVRDDAGALGDQIWAADDVKLVGMLPDAELRNAAADVAPCTGERRDAGDCPDGLATTVVPLQRHTHADRGRLRGGKFVGELADVGGRHARDLGSPFRGARARTLLQLLKADRVVINIVLVDKALLDDGVDQRHGQRAVRARLWRDVPVGTLRRARGEGVDDHDLGALLLGVLHDRPMVQVRADGVARPDDDVLGMDVAVRVEARRRTNCEEPGGAGTLAAEGPLSHGRAHAVEEGITAVQPVNQSLVAEVAVGSDGLRPILVDDCLPARDDGVECLVPCDALELLRALWPDPTHWIEQAIGMVVTLLVVLQLHAETAAGHRVIGVAAHAQELSVLDLEQHGAGIRAIVRTAAEEGLAYSLGLSA